MATLLLLLTTTGEALRDGEDASLDDGVSQTRAAAAEPSVVGEEMKGETGREGERKGEGHSSRGEEDRRRFLDSSFISTAQSLEGGALISDASLFLFLLE